MNRDIVLSHLSEALEELTRIVERLGTHEVDEDYLRASLAHLYNHVNTAWNARDASEDCYRHFSEEQFFKWRAFPGDIDMGPPDPESI